MGGTYNPAEMNPTSSVVIEDIRTEKEFAGITFSGYKTTAVKTQLSKSLVSGDIESAQYWAAELLCAGHVMIIWEVCFLICSRYIHRANPRIISYIAVKLGRFRRLARAGEFKADLEMRNHADIRGIFAEMIAVICLSPKQHSLDNVSIKPADFKGETIALRSRAPNTLYADRVFRHGEGAGDSTARPATASASSLSRQIGDPPQIYVALNEFMYSISEEGLNLQMACFWAEWICDLEAQSRKRKLSLSILPRTNAPVEDKYMDDPVWILWEGIFDTIQRRGNTKERETLHKLAHDILSIYSLRFTPSIKKRRRFLLYMLISYVVEIPAFERPVVYQTAIVEAICRKIGAVYQELKQYEVRTLGSRMMGDSGDDNQAPLPEPLPSYRPQPPAPISVLPLRPNLPPL